MGQSKMHLFFITFANKGGFAEKNMLVGERICTRNGLQKEERADEGTGSTSAG